MGKVTKGIVLEDGEWVTTETSPTPVPEERKYQIAQSKSSQDLEAYLHEYIKNGWKPLGGIQVIRTGQDHLSFYQAIIKE